jgi:hypothetical protein
MQFEAGGEILLSVPRYDFGWQHGYVLAEPKRLPKGTVIRCTAIYDNTPANPNNADPNSPVQWGTQSTDEMFQGALEITRTHEDRVHESSTTFLSNLASTLGIFLASSFLLWKRLEPRSPGKLSRAATG